MSPYLGNLHWSFADCFQRYYLMVSIILYLLSSVVKTITFAGLKVFLLFFWLSMCLFAYVPAQVSVENVYFRKLIIFCLVTKAPLLYDFVYLLTQISTDFDFCFLFFITTTTATPKCFCFSNNGSIVSWLCICEYWWNT